MPIGLAAYYGGWHRIAAVAQHNHTKTSELIPIAVALAVSGLAVFAGIETLRPKAATLSVVVLWMASSVTYYVTMNKGMDDRLIAAFVNVLGAEAGPRWKDEYVGGDRSEFEEEKSANWLVGFWTGPITFLALRRNRAKASISGLERTKDHNESGAAMNRQQPSDTQ